MDLDLVVRWHNFGMLEQDVQVLYGEVRDADGANFACCPAQHLVQLNTDVVELTCVEEPLHFSPNIDKVWMLFEWMGA